MAYKKFYNFGKNMNRNVTDVNNPSNPLSYCLFDTPSVQFLHGSTAATYKPQCQECQSYMSLRCSGQYSESENWDGYCEIYFNGNTDTYWPNEAAIEKIPACIINMCGNLTIGQKMLRNSLEKRFLEFPYCSKKYIQFDPNVANSPLIDYPNGCECNYTSVIVKLGGDLSQLNNDRLLNKAIDNYRCCADVLSIMYDFVIKYKINLNNTRLGEHFRQHSDFIKK